MKLTVRRAATLAAVVLGVGGLGMVWMDRQLPAVASPELWPSPAGSTSLLAPDLAARVEARLAAMTVAQKVGQTVQADIGSIQPADLARWPIGSVLVGGDGGPGGDDRAPLSAWLSLTGALHAAAAAQGGPGLLIGVDAVHGHNNIVGAVIFPHNIGLGAARDPDLAGRIAAATAESMAATGMNWNFAPTLAVPRDPRWGRTYEGYGEDPALVASYAGPVVRGFQGDPGGGVPRDRVAATAKHFLGDGGTDQGTDQGDTRLGEAELIEVHAAPYRAAIDAGVLTVMASFSSWNGEKMHGNRSLLTDVLKGRMGFQGLVVGDWNGHEQLPGCRADSCPAAFNAGIDIFMAPTAWKALFQSLIAQVESGEIPMERLDDAVRRILRVKAKLGLLDGGRPPVDPGRVSTPEHRALAREAVQKSLVLLKNDGALPIDPAARVLVTGPAAADIATACGGWTLTWQGNGNKNEHFPNGESIASGLDEALERAEISADGTFTAKPDLAVVVFGESPYTEGKGDVKNLEYGPREPLRILRALREQGIRTVAVLLSGRPLQVEAELAASDAFVAAWLPGTEGGGVADVLLGKVDFTGRLPHPWPGRTERDRPFEVGHGLRLE